MNFFTKQSGLKETYSQSGEDMIIQFVLANHLNTTTPNYLDIGANDPIYMNNTYKFYKKGSNGVIIDPDPDLARVLKKKRPKDTVLNVGITKAKGVKEFFLLNPDTLNTFSKREVEQYKNFYNASIRDTVMVKTDTINNIINRYFKNGLDILSIDVEGLDFEIIKNIVFKRYRPKVICIESMIYGDGNTLTKSNKILKLMFENQYFIYADTFVNSIFVDQILWDTLKQPKLINMRGYKG
jgi:FkbM family methyltransferase